MTYTVKTGDSLSSIARDLLGDIDFWPEIALINSIGDPSKIYPGQTLTIPDMLPEHQVTAKKRDWKKIMIITSIVIVIIIAGIIYYKRKK